MLREDPNQKHPDPHDLPAFYGFKWLLNKFQQNSILYRVWNSNFEWITSIWLFFLKNKEITKTGLVRMTSKILETERCKSGSELSNEH